MFSRWRALGAARNVIILEMARQCDAVAEASPNALKCDFRCEDNEGKGDRRKRNGTLFRKIEGDEN
jgi:hypothetical protein